MSTPTTYDISRVLQALGARTSRAIPSIDTAQLIPTITLGDFSTTFAPEAIEGRGITPSGNFGLGAGQWAGIYIQSLSPGGLVVEAVRSDGALGFAFFRCAEAPWAGGTLQPIFPIGGVNVQAQFNFINTQPNPPPNIPALQDGIEWQSVVGGAATTLQVFDRWWVPPGSFFGCWDGALATLWPIFRFREIAQEQGPV